jgi:8-oxo-dGTP pyrophosphatase MutT (NUDIX family)
MMGECLVGPTEGDYRGKPEPASTPPAPGFPSPPIPAKIVARITISSAMPKISSSPRLARRRAAIDKRNPWTTLRSRSVYDNPWIGVTEHGVLNPRGGAGIYGVVHFKNLAIGIVPIDHDGTTYLVGQYRYPLGDYSWEIPEGGGARDIAPLHSAQRELAEETGLGARHWREIGQLALSNSVTDERAHLFVAWDLRQGDADPEDSEALVVRREPFPTVLRMVERGVITDAMSVAALQRVQLLALTGKLPRRLAASILGRP